MPDEKTKRRIFNIHTSRMTLSDDVDLEELIMAKDDLSGADIKVRSRVMVVMAARHAPGLAAFALPRDAIDAIMILRPRLQAVCTEAGLLALRERRMKVTQDDFRKSKENVLYRKQEGTPEGMYL